LSPEPAFYRGVIQERKGNLPEALVALEESLRLDPTSVYALNNKGNILIDLGRLDEALHCFDLVLSHTDSYPLAYYNRACVFALRGKVREAVQALGLAAAQDPHFLEDAMQDSDFDRVRESRTFLKLVEGSKSE
jgi:tetratricopeptide (TPR) repeat protein